MAEFVQQNIEETIPELEQLERVGLLTKKEIKDIIKKRTHHEYRLVRRQREKEDFLKYIQYEASVLAFIKKRRNRLHYFFKKDEIEMAIITRVLKFYKRACTQYPDDLKVWFAYIQFAMEWNMMQELSRVYTRLLKVHSDNPGLWIMAAKFQMEDNSSSDNARGLMLRALRHHPKSHALWKEYFRLELMNADKQRKRYALLKQSQMDPNDDDMSDAIIQGEIARMVYRQAVQQMPDDLDLHLLFLPIAQKFDFTQHLLDEMYSDLQEKHANQELAWDALSRRHLTHDAEVEEPVQVSEETQCHEVFETALKTLPTVSMWTMYINFCIERLESGGSMKVSNQRARKTLDTLDRAHKACEELPEEVFLKWLTVLVNVGKIEDALRLAQRAVSVHKKSVPLWCHYLQLVILYQDTDEEQQRIRVRTLFDEAVSNVKSKNSLPLWNIGVGWCLANDADNIETLLQVGVREHKHVALRLKEHYLEWAFLQGGIKTVRKVYTFLAKEKPLSVEFFHKYIAIESTQLEPKMKHIRSCYEDALREYGTTRPDLWLDYIKLEMTHPKGNPTNGPSLHWRAMQALEGDHVEAFTIKYTLMQTGH